MISVYQGNPVLSPIAPKTCDKAVMFVINLQVFSGAGGLRLPCLDRSVAIAKNYGY
ncbi:MAG: hypothetical protein ACO31I_00405 [Prochlorotrichaceae cyanobacterium]